jgi:hypothetical protein
MWCEITARLSRFAADHPDNSLSIKYEDLAAEPEVTMRRVFEFIGVDFDPALVESALTRRENIGPGDFKAYQRAKVDTSSVDRWKKLSADTRSRIGAILNPTLESLGYETIPVRPLASAEDMRRRYQMGLLLQSMKRPSE